MKIEIINSGPSGLFEILLSHGTESSRWDVSAYARTSDRAASLDTAKMFEEINGYWASLAPERQKSIWDVYQDIKNILDTNYELSAIHLKVQKSVKRLYDLMPLLEIQKWFHFHSRVRIPTTLKEQYGPQDPQDRTYLRGDYVDLVVLCVALRPMVPIWGEYISNTKRETGSTFKELMALSLLSQCYLVHSTPFNRIKAFIEASVKHSMDQGPSATAVLGGMGSTELPDWVLALTMVRRLAVGEISAPDDTSHIITNVYQYINNTLKSMDRKFGGKFGGKVSEKMQPTSGGEEDKTSVVEMYKVKQEVSDGDLVIVNVYTELVYEMALKVEPDIDMTRVTQCLQASKALENLPIQPHQITLVQWVMATCLPARGIPLLTKPALLRSIAVTQAVLWHWGFFDLAAMVSASPLPNVRGVMVAMMESRGRIPKEYMAQLEELYPHYQQQRGKQTTARQLNVAARAVDAFCELVTRDDWQLHVPADLLVLTSRHENTKKLVIPGDIRAHLARLIIKIAR